MEGDGDKSFEKLLYQLSYCFARARQAGLEPATHVVPQAFGVILEKSGLEPGDKV